MRYARTGTLLVGGLALSVALTGCFDFPTGLDFGSGTSGDPPRSPSESGAPSEVGPPSESDEGEAADDGWLTFSFEDPPADDGGPVDVVFFRMDIDPSSGDYRIHLRASEEAPFRGAFRINVNIVDETTDTFFSDAMNDYQLQHAEDQIVLRGTAPTLRSWSAGDRVRTVCLYWACDRFYRSAVSSLPLEGFRESEDLITPGIHASKGTLVEIEALGRGRS